MMKILMSIKNFFITIFNKIKAFFIKLSNTKVIKTISKPFKKIDEKFRCLPNPKKNAITGYIYILPWIIGFLIFGLYELLYSLRISFAESATYITNPKLGRAEFVMNKFGLYQYTNIFKNNPEHIKTITSVITDTWIVVPLVVIFALVLALLLKSKIKGIGIFRTVFFIPVILLSGSMLSYFSQYGLLNMPGSSSEYLNKTIGFYFSEEVSELISFIFGKIILILWLSGVQTIIFLAGLNKISKSVYEAASIEGASGWECFWKITLPALSSLIIINIVYTTVIYCNLSNNALVMLIDLTMKDSVKYGRDYASALSWILFIIELLTIGLFSFVVKLVFKKYK